MSYKATILCIDPPYLFKDPLTMSETPRGAMSNYPPLTIEELKKLPIADIADPSGALLALWCPSSLIQSGLDLMKVWNFDFKQTWIWVKIKKNINMNGDINDVLSMYMGHTFRQCHEICLLGINNTKVYKKRINKAQRSVSFAANARHSEKPEELQNRLDIMFGNNVNKIELFARRQRKGTICIGNEAPMTLNEDIRLSLSKLMDLSDDKIVSIKEIISLDKIDNEKLVSIWND